MSSRKTISINGIAVIYGSSLVKVVTQSPQLKVMRDLDADRRSRRRIKYCCVGEFDRDLSDSPLSESIKRLQLDCNLRILCLLILHRIAEAMARFSICITAHA